MTLRERLDRLRVVASSAWRVWLQIRRVIVLARVPLLVALVAAFFARQVNEVRELMLIAAVGWQGWQGWQGWLMWALGTARSSIASPSTGGRCHE